LSQLFDWLSRDARVLDVARQILDSEVYVHQSRVNLKPGFRGKEFYWHSDFETWHVEDGMPRMRALSVSIALTQNYPFNGPLMLIPGSHKTYVSCVGETPKDHYRQSLKKQEYGVPDKESLQRLADHGGIVAPTGAAGSAVFFDCNLMHGSNSNISPYPRSNVFFVYNSMENTLGEPLHGLKPRPEYIAARERFEAVKPLERG
jgi:ectoine hydroxylase